MALDALGKQVVPMHCRKRRFGRLWRGDDAVISDSSIRQESL